MKAFVWMVPAVMCATWLATAPAEARSRCDDRRTVFGLTDDQRLVWFRDCQPERVRDIGSVWGFKDADTTLVGMDVRVQDGKLYGVGNAGGVYVIDTKTAEITRVSQLTVALDGVSFGVDFNPAADRLRIVSNTGQNLRHNVNAGGTTIADGALNYVAGTPAPGITGAAYTNNDLNGTTATTLFDLDTMLDQMAIQAPPNAGSLSATGMLGLDAGSAVGFDIHTTLKDGVAVANRGFAALTSAGPSGFYAVSLLTGRATLIGYFRHAIVDIAVALD